MFDSVVRSAIQSVGILCIMLLPDSANSEALDPGSTLCLHPVQIPVDEEDAGERRSNIEEKLTQALKGASFSVADPNAVRDLVERTRAESGGFIDPLTGQRDEPRYLRYRNRLATALHNDLNCDGQLIAQVVLVRARFAMGFAYWDGASIPVISTGRAFMQVIGGVYETGWVNALSLWLEVLDLEGNGVAFRSAGIEPLVQFAVLRDVDSLPDDLWLTDTEKINAAIALALGDGGVSLREQGTPF